MIKRVRQGDVLLERVKEIPAAAKPVEHDGSHVLAYGEATGHKHVVSVEEKKDLLVFDLDGTTYLSVLAPVAPLTHEEHPTREVPTGLWKRRFERTYDLHSRHIRRVQD